LIVGCGNNNDVLLFFDEYVLMCYVCFEFCWDGVYIEDIGLMNGMFVNGIWFMCDCKLMFGDVVCIGEIDLRFEL